MTASVFCLVALLGLVLASAVLLGAARSLLSDVFTGSVHEQRRAARVARVRASTDAKKTQIRRTSVGLAHQLAQEQAAVSQLMAVVALMAEEPPRSGHAGRDGRG